MRSREQEAEVVSRCVWVARGTDAVAHDSHEANVFLIAAMIIGPRFRSEAQRWHQAGEAYFARDPAARLTPSEVVRNGWVTSLPRFRELLSATLST